MMHPYRLLLVGLLTVGLLAGSCFGQGQSATMIGVRRARVLSDNYAMHCKDSSFIVFCGLSVIIIYADVPDFDPFFSSEVETFIDERAPEGKCVIIPLNTCTADVCLAFKNMCSGHTTLSNLQCTVLMFHCTCRYSGANCESPRHSRCYNCLWDLTDLC